MQVDEESSSEESEEEVCGPSCPKSCSFPTHLAQVEEFYTPGSLELLEARRYMAEYSLPRLDFR